MDTARNIVILPDLRARTEAIRRSALVSKLSHGLGATNRIVLSPEYDRWPHITLYQFGMPKENVSSLQTVVEKIASEVKPFHVTMKGYQLYCGTGIFWLVEKPYPLLQNFHEKTVCALNLLREGVVPSQHRDLFAADSGLTCQQRTMLGHWGYPTAFREYRPHITIGDTVVAKEILHEFPMDPFEVVVDKIHLTDLGPRGTCPGPLVSFRLHGSS